MVFLTRILEFSAAHRLFNPRFTEAENREEFGNCSNYHGHGHNYRLEVTIAGPVRPETGMVLDLKKMKEIIRREIIDRVDHKHLNYDVPFLEGINPTAENMAVAFWEELRGKFPNARLYEIRVYETDRSFATYRGGEEG
jgi:6-pyruvoyltetrahydropterin/6-carboxytetrahydropterin synthase